MRNPINVVFENITLWRKHFNRSNRSQLQDLFWVNLCDSSYYYDYDA